MKRSLTFSQKILNLLVMQNQEQLINSFNKLSTNYYLREKKHCGTTPHITSNTDQIANGN